MLLENWLSKNTSWLNDNLIMKVIEVSNDFTIVGLDKAPNNLSFICKQFAFLAVRGRLEEGGFYNCYLPPLDMINIMKEELNYRKIPIASCFLPSVISHSQNS